MITKLTKILLALLIAPILIIGLVFSGVLTLVFSPLSVFARLKTGAKPEASVKLTERIKFVENKEIDYTPARQHA